MRLQRSIDRERWLDVARSCEWATFFQTPFWSDVAAAGGDWEDATVAARLDDGTEVVYPLQRRRRRVAALAPAAATWAGCYGGPIATRPLSAGEATELHEAVRRRFRRELRITLSPFGPQEFASGAFEVRPDFTQVIDLREGFDAVLRSYSQGQRKAYRRGKRDGVVTRSTSGDDAVGDYVAMYRANLSRWGKRAGAHYPRAVFDVMGGFAEREPRLVRLWLASVEGQLGCGVWAFYWNRHVVAWHAASYEQLPGQRVKPWAACYTDIIEEAVGRGFERFDFNPSGGNEGTVEFKRRCGAESLGLKRLRHADATAQAADRLVRIGRRLVPR